MQDTDTFGKRTCSERREKRRGEERKRGTKWSKLLSRQTLVSLCTRKKSTGEWNLNAARAAGEERRGKRGKSEEAQKPRVRSKRN